MVIVKPFYGVTLTKNKKQKGKEGRTTIRPIGMV